jgi:hypothetical protein
MNWSINNSYFIIREHCIKINFNLIDLKMQPKFGIRAVLFAFAIPLLFSCDQDKADTGNQLMEIKLQEPFQKNIKLSELISLEKTLVIDSNGFLDFGEVSSIQKLGDHFVVHNAFPQTVSILDLSGKVIKQIAPDYQLKQISEVSVVDDQVIVLDRGPQALHFYDKDLNLFISRNSLSCHLNLLTIYARHV